MGRFHLYLSELAFGNQLQVLYMFFNKFPLGNIHVLRKQVFFRPLFSILSKQNEAVKVFFLS